MFHMVVRSHKLGEMEIKCTFHNFIVWASSCQALSNLVKIWQSYDKNNFDCFFLRHGVLTRARVAYAPRACNAHHRLIRQLYYYHTRWLVKFKCHGAWCPLATSRWPTLIINVHE